MTEVDVVIVGAGISGIGAAYHLKDKLPDKTFTILEARERLGGTWDLFKYPGIRSDSDMYTLGFSFAPWKHDKAIAEGGTIWNYLDETARAHGIDRAIRYKHRVERARWSSSTARWTLDVRDDRGELVQVTCKFLFACAGYYNYDAGYTPELPGIETFRGQIVHPQQWTQDIDHAGKRVVVIGSGATAVTLVPAMAETAAHVTMLQRSPTYVVSVPASDKAAAAIARWLPEQAAYGVTRWKNILLSTAFYKYARRFPDSARKFLIGNVRKAIGDTVDVEKHFTPSYKPWDQRLCLIPDGDLYKSINDGKVSVVTDHIERFTETGIRLKSGEELQADLVVTATGLRLQMLGGITLEIDGVPVDPAKRVFYKGLMLSDVPNLAIAIGYTNASWTLKSELTGVYVCRLLQHMDRHGYTAVTPRRHGHVDDGERPLLELMSGYVQRAVDQFPRQGSVMPWRLYQNFLLDRAMLRYARIDDNALEFTRAEAPRTILLPLLERAARRKLHKSGVRSEYVPTPLGRVHLYDAPGSGALPTIVLLHGLGASAAGYAPVLARLREHAQRVVAVELPGHGFSDPSSTPLTPELLLETTSAVLDTLDGPLVLVGNSLGGAVATHYAIAHPDRVAGLVLLSPGGAETSDDDWTTLKRSFDMRSRRDALAFAARVQHRVPPLVHLLAHELAGSMKRPAVRDLMATTRRDHGLAETPAEISKLAMPILLWWGQSERLLPRAHLAWWRTHLPAHAIVEEPAGIGHCPHLDDSARVAQRIVEFTERATTPARSEPAPGSSASPRRGASIARS